MATFHPQRIDTERLLLREPHVEEAEAIFEAYASDPQVARYTTWRAHSSLEETRAFLGGLVDAWRAALDWTWIIELKSTGAVVGAIGVRRQKHEVTLGYVLSRAHWGKGLMPEAAAAVMDRAFQDPKVFRVCAHCDVDNLASARVMEKIGMQREGLLRSTLLHPNIQAEPRDGYIYAKVRKLIHH
jgi:ribosomal-protein-alanine N-acetyltransferase